MEMPIVDLKLTSVSQNVAKRFIWNIDNWLGPKVMSVPHISHLVTCTLEELFEHAHVMDANLWRIHYELTRKYRIHFEMTDYEIRYYYNLSLMGRPFGSTYKGPGTMDYLSMRYALDDDIVKSVAIYQERYIGQKRKFRDIAFVQYSSDMDRSGIKDIHEFAAKVISENGMLQQDYKDLEPAQTAGKAGKALNLKQSIKTNKVMTHTDLEYYLSTDLGRLLRPSQRKAILDAWWNEGIKQYKDLCAMKEEDFKNLPFVDDTLFAKAKAHLEEYGLRFGMTEEELIAYQDEEYLQQHPEESETATTEAGETDEDAIVLDEDELEQRIEDAIKAEGIEDRPLPEWSSEECRKQLMEKVRDGRAFKDTNSDYEWFKYRSLYVAFLHQPWYYRFLYSTDERISLAKEEADKLMETYTKDLIEQEVACACRDYEDDCKIIREQNEKNDARRKAIREEQSSQYRAELLQQKREKNEAAEALKAKECDSMEEIPF